MNVLLKYFVDLCLLRTGPQDLPASPTLFRLAIAADVLISLLLSLSMRLETGPTILQGFVEIALLLALLWLVLNLTNNRARFLQSATAALGSSALLGVAALPVISLAGSSDEDLALLAGLSMLGLVIWSIVVLGHILRHALEIRQGQGVMLAVGYTFFSYALMGLLFPATPT
jgi:hypothetical protein